MFANLALHLRRLSSRRIIRLERIDSVRIRRTLRFYVGSLAALLEAERCNIFVYDPNAAKAWLKVGTGVSEGEFEIPMKNTLVGDVIASGRTLIANDPASRKGAHLEINTAAHFVTRNAVYAPVRSRYHGEVIGVIEVINKLGDAGFGPADASLLEEAAEGVQDLVDSVFLDQEVYGAADEFVTASRWTLLTVIGLIVLGSVLTLLLVAAWSVMPVINEAVSPPFSPLAPGPGR
jgi:hypothetical protein